MLAGGLIAAAGLAPALLVVGGAYFATTMLPALLPQWRQINRPPADTDIRRPNLVS